MSPEVQKPRMPHLKVGVVMENAQISDMAFIDILDQLTVAHVKTVASYGMAQFLPLAIEIDWHYIGNSLSPTLLAPAIQYLPSHTYEDAPRNLDILFIGGVPVEAQSEAGTRFVREASEATRLIFTTCLGSLWLAKTGALDGKSATTNRAALVAAREWYPKVRWLDQRWAVDGNMWTSGGPGSAIDMVATYVMENYNKQFAKICCWDGLDFDPTVRGKFFTDSTNEEH